MSVVTMGQGNTKQAGLSRYEKKSRTPEDLPDALPENIQLLESDEYQERFLQLQKFRRQTRVAHRDNREQMAIDEDYYDGIQLSAEDEAILNERNQPANYFNVTKNTINFLLGTEKASKVDYSIRPRKKQDAPEAKTKTKVMKYVEDVNRAEYARSKAFEDSVKAGIGWIEEGVRSDEFEEPLYSRNEDWRNMWFDNLGREPDLSDWRYILREKWVDLDIAIDMFPEREDELRLMAVSVNSLYPYIPEDLTDGDTASEFEMEDTDSLLGGTNGGMRERVRLCEMWYRWPEKVKVLKATDEKNSPYGALHNTIYRTNEPAHDFLVEGGHFSLFDTKKMVMRCAMWTGNTLLQDVRSPYNHNRFPFIPVFCYRFKRNGLPYGYIRDIRSPQDDLNKRRNKSLFLLSASKILYEDGAVGNPAVFLEEYNRPDCVAQVEKGALSGQKIKIVDNVALSREHLEMARDSERFIHNIAGVSAEQQGQSQRDLSGKAMLALQSQGAKTSGPVFDNYYFSFQLAGEIRLSNTEQFYDQEKELRITGDERVDDFIEINKRDEKSGEIENSILKSKADFIVGKQDFRESMRIAARDMLSELITKVPPDVGLALLDMVLDLYDDLNGKEEMVARIRKINGQSGPDDEMSPEDKQAREETQKAQAQKQAEQEAFVSLMQELQAALLKAQVQGEEGKAAKTEAEALKIKLEGFIQAMETAGAVDIAPNLVMAADALVLEAGQIGRVLPPRQITQQPPAQPPMMA